MIAPLPQLPSDAETVADLRALYRASEARAARLRLLSALGRELALAEAGSTDAIQRCAQLLALFVGQPIGRIVHGTGAEAQEGLSIVGPGSGGRLLGRLIIPGVAEATDIADTEDRETVRLAIDLLGAALDRFAREAERDALVAALAEREARLELLIGRLFSAQEDERRRLSHDLHDGVAQTASALVRMLEGAGSGSETPILPQERRRLADVARGMVRDLRAVIGGLRPPQLDDLGLTSALQSLGDGLAADGYSVTMELDAAMPRLPEPVEGAFFRIAQEAATNIRKHAGGPCPVVISLARQEDDWIAMHIVDRGCGFAGALGPGEQIPGHQVGLEGMRERITALGGRFELTSVPDSGTRVSAFLPRGNEA